MTLFAFKDPPLIEVKKIVRHKALPGDFPTAKSPFESIRSSSPLMRDALIHLDTDPGVHEIAASPNEFEYSTSPHLYSKAKLKTHTPALRYRKEHGRYVFIDVIPRSLQSAMKNLKGRTERLTEVLNKEYGAGYGVADELSLHIQPRHRNLKIMWRVGRHADEHAKFAVLSALQDAVLPISIGELRERVHLPSPQFTVFDDVGNALFSRELIDVDRAFSAVMALSITGIVAPDLSRQFSDTTLIHWRGTSARRIF